MNLGFALPWALVGMIVAIVPWMSTAQPAALYSSIQMLPDDRFSRLADRAVRFCASLALLTLVLGLAGPYLKEHWVDRVGTGAQIVLLVDRSSSMNENFAGRYLGGAARETKSAVARILLSEFVQRRKDDLFAVVSFSAAPVYVLPLTQDRDAVLAAVNGFGERGQGVTNIGSGLVMALDFFTGRPVSGARVILLVSDGAARIEEETRARIQQAFADTRARLYWIYLRTRTSPRLADKPENPGESTTPEFFLHDYFQKLGTPYQAHEADNPDALRDAIAAIEQLENEPLNYQQKLPREDLSALCYIAALAFLLPVLVSRVLEIQRWGA
jgi:mxaC protein